MWNIPDKDTLDEVPGLHETEHISLRDKIIHLHFFIGGCDWYVVEFDGHDIMCGYVMLNNDLDCAEWGYISLKELKSIKISPGIEVDFDLHWNKRPASQVSNICEGMGWQVKSKGGEIRYAAN